MTRRASLFLPIVLAAGPLAGADWLQFRGTDGSATSAEADLPLAWSESENIAWKADLPGRGVSSPIIASGRVMVTASSGFRQDRLHVLCFDAARGAKLWERQLWATGRTLCHPKTCMAAPTPASDGARIFAFYSTNDLAALDLDGNLLWYRGLTHDYPNASLNMGMASSPLVAGGVLVVQVENDSQPFAAGLDVKTGENIWKIVRPAKPNWSSPILLRGKTPGEDTIILESRELVSAHDPATGRTLWTHTVECSSIASCAAADDVIFVPANGITALRHNPGSAAPEVLWQSARLGTSMSSPVALGGKIYAVNGAGVLACADGKSGQELWKLRLQGAVSSTPVAAGGRLYAINEDGLVQVVKLDGKEEIVARSELKETILATPAISGCALYIRSDAHLWKIAKPAAGARQ